MKRILVSSILVLSLFFTMAYAENSEITFHGIPWLSDETVVMKTLNDNGLLRDSSLQTLQSEKCTVLNQDDVGFIWPAKIDNVDSCFSVSLEKVAKGKIAGYPVKDLSLTYAYDGELKLITIVVDLIGADYESLKDKLTKAHGESKRLYDEEGLESFVWEGMNKSCIVLYTPNNGKNFELVYGRLDATEILEKCSEYNADDISGL